MALLSLCVLGSVVAIARELPARQLLAGWIAQAGAIPGLVLGFAVSLDSYAWRRFKRTVLIIAIASVLVALLHNLGLLRGQAFEMIEGPRQDRGLISGERFSYAAGIFRTANVFAAFLAFSALIIVIDYSERLANGLRRLTASSFAVLGLLFLGALIAARRSGLIMLLGSLAPFLFAIGGRLRVMGLMLAAAAILYVVIDVDGAREAELRQKLAFATTELHVGERLSNAFDVSGEDWAILSISGEGLGSVGAAATAGGREAYLRDVLLLKRHPAIHVGWFKDLYAYGYVGAPLHLIWFLLLLVATVRVQGDALVGSQAARWSGAGFLLVVIVNYYFVATSWLQSVTGGLLFGLAIGVFLGRMRTLAVSPRSDQNGSHRLAQTGATPPSRQVSSYRAAHERRPSTLGAIRPVRGPDVTD
jgi:hypothetical protein